MTFEIRISKIKFYSYNGCLKEESLIGGEYIFNINIQAKNTSYITDELHKTVNYSEVYKITEEEFQKSYKLIETLAYKVFKRIKKLPGVINCKIELKKINPPINGNVEEVSVIFAS
ncbi:dihydroneopterin aldolase [Schleiferia thermophila]|uniref:7,8-dihydroneopterin aldolase n=1 Tax=Schleiferia thermophila TaxID=884107 RepID=A0A369A2W7_9FLAO|nr:dihydroneopterin aldolase [Schleiferia thermophila]RCX03652.1 dihydroneopterin aldolase [Schleiferia thermophila]GCD79886.1 7,8-dihydroneopterin aldolase [Schleiferia thermophila]